MARSWQEFDDSGLFCHSWPDLDERRITAMTYFLFLTAVIALFLLLLLHDLRSDPRGDRRPPASHPRDDRFLPPSVRR
jgi:hypothetical protein